MLKIINLSKSYDNINVINNINFEVKEREFISILGESGCGKSTLLNCLTGLTKPDTGQIIYNNQDITKYNDKELSLFRLNEIGYIFQEHNLLECLNVEENIKLPLVINKKNNVNIKELLSIVKLDGFEKRKINTLSGGQKQRVAIARSLVNNPKIIFADEPTSSLNKDISLEIKAIFKNIVENHNKTVIMVTHSETMSSNTKILKIIDGKLNNEI